MNVIILIGIPGSGKSSYVNTNFSEYQVIDTDSIKDAIGMEFQTIWPFPEGAERYRKISAIDAVAQTICKAHMQQGRNIIVEDLIVTKEKLVEWLDIADKYSYKKKAIILNEDLMVCSSRRKDFPIELLTELFAQFKVLLENENLLNRFDERINI